MASLKSLGIESLLLITQKLSNMKEVNKEIFKSCSHSSMYRALTNKEDEYNTINTWQCKGYNTKQRTAQEIY